jgi:hypothetical protein
MALEDKRSRLQPGSVQAQQYRLQFTNLQPVSVTAQQPSPVANARPAVSAFASVPAPVSIPTPQPAVSQTPAAVPSTFRQAAFFNGATVFSASLATGNDFIFEYNNKAFSVDLTFKPAAPDSLRHTIFHTYSGSFMSQSLELFITGSYLVLELTNGTTTFNGQVVEQRAHFTRDLSYLESIGRTGHMTNGFTYFSARIQNLNGLFVDMKFKANSFNTNSSIPIPPDFNTSNNTHFYVGGSPAKNSYFSGSIASMLFLTGSTVTNQQWGDMALRDVNPTTVSPQLRTYTFNNTPAEFTGSQASFSRPLELVAGTLSYVDSYLKL